jgi:SNF2 family DNA or RNA helicase
MLRLIETVVKDLSIPYCVLTGETRQRTELVERFQTGGVPLFLISLKAGGTGLNLTAADTIIHYDPWWNPAVEAQATDRAHRIGQDKPVFVYKLIAQRTVEEKIMQLQADKHALVSQLYAEKSAANPTCTAVLPSSRRRTGQVPVTPSTVNRSGGCTRRCACTWRRVAFINSAAATR